MSDSDIDLIDIGQAAKLLGISLPTFRKLRQERDLSSAEILIGKRIKFHKQKLMRLLSGTQIIKAAPSSSRTEKLCIFSTDHEKWIDEQGNVDLTKIKLVDPYGCLCLLTYFIERSRATIPTKIKVDDGDVCRELRHIGFFNLVEDLAPLANWDREKLSGATYFSAHSLLPITILRRKGEERKVAEKLLEIFLQHGFSENIGGYLGWVLGELGDNSLTHSHELLSERVCFIQAQRYSLGKDTNCVIVAIADLGMGIHQSLKKNPKHKRLSEAEAFLSAFRHTYSSWPDEAKRGKGLTDMLTIALGNRSFFRATSSDFDFLFDCREGSENILHHLRTPSLKSGGTKFGFVLIDKNLSPVERDEADVVMEKEIKKWKTQL